MDTLHRSSSSSSRRMGAPRTADSSFRRSVRSYRVPSGGAKRNTSAGAGADVTVGDAGGEAAGSLEQADAPVRTTMVTTALFATPWNGGTIMAPSLLD